MARFILDKMEMKLGPLGDYSCGEKWQEYSSSPISHIFVTYHSRGVTSIQFGYVENGALVLSTKYGSIYDDDSIRIVRLNHESEFVTGISGEEWGADITSLTIHTNERKHLAYHGGKFDSPKMRRPETTEYHSGIHDRREFGGFFGSSDCYKLRSVAVSHFMEMIRAGPIGDTESKTHTHWDEKGKAMVSHIFVSFDSYIKSIQFGYSEKGAIVMSEKYGGSSEGHNLRVVKLKHNEFVTWLSGVLNLNDRINSLTFYTNLGKHGPICEPAVNKYLTSFEKEIVDLGICDRREFGGFFGSCDGSRLTSIGIYVSPIPSSSTAAKRENV
ncbi:unnamed protein product [Thlaspi arvense]|uniref:Jacalin-type lectin domain-containing protein n=1 Tax=Thlaspi arvense TaxID=13288 RepID=A0AAU9S467_THLAR|nr:unnamed protein product [Thlaspi arvense]